MFYPMLWPPLNEHALVLDSRAASWAVGNIQGFTLGVPHGFPQGLLGPVVYTTSISCADIQPTSQESYIVDSISSATSYIIYLVIFANMTGMNYTVMHFKILQIFYIINFCFYVDYLFLHFWIYSCSFLTS
jgi:hypothetical protein